MLMQLTREWFTDNSTIGELKIADEFECFTLEPVVRDKKIDGETAIPAGTYEIAISFSDRFQRKMPELLNVPNFVGVRIHPGNYPKDTKGCILVGQTRGVDFIGQSRDAFGSLFDKILDAIENEKVFIGIIMKK